MKNSTIKKLDTGSNRSDARVIRMKNIIRLIITTAALLAASSAFAGNVVLPTSVMYADPGLAQVNIQNLGDETIRISTTGLTGEWIIQGSDFPPEYDIATTDKVVLPFDQELDIIIDLAEGTVSGHASMDWSSPELALFASVRGTATCLPLNGLECGQLVVDLELQGALSDPNDPASVGRLSGETLGSLIVDIADYGIWAAMSANATIGGNEALINSLLEMMEEGEGIQATPWTDGQVTE